MNKRNIALAIVSLLIAALSSGMTSCSNNTSVQSAPLETVGNVAVIVAQHTSVPDWLEAVGTARAAQTSEIASQTMGNLVEVRAREGDRVQGGQVLATLDDTQPRAAVEQATAAVTAAQKEVSYAESEFALTEATLKRYQKLYEKQTISPQEYDQIKTRHQSAEARLEMSRAGLAQADAALVQARTVLSYKQIRAPFAGVITEKRADAGTFASAGMVLFTIEDTRRYRLEVTVDESDLRLVRVAQTVSVLLDAVESGEFSGRVTQIVPAADPASRSFLVKIELAGDSRLRSGLFGRAHFLRGERRALLIPQAAVVEHGQLRGVFVVDASHIAQLRYLTLGTASGQNVEVLSGLQDGERFIAAPGNRELSGKQITAKP